MRTQRADKLLALPLRHRGIQLGRPVDALLDREVLNVLGVEVVCRDGACRFLPFPTAVVGKDALVIQSPFVLLEQGELAFYRKRSLALSSLRGCRVEQGGHELGPLVDVVVAPDGALADLVV